MNKIYFPLIIIFIIFFTVENRLDPKLFSLDAPRLIQGIQSQIENAAFYTVGRYPEEETVHTDTGKSQLAQYEIDILVRHEQPNPPNTNTYGLFMRIIKACPNIDYKILVFTPNLNWDPGISHSNSGQFIIIPGFTQQACDRVYLASDRVEK